MSELRQNYDRLKGEQAHCPNAEQIRLHRDGLLDGEEARRVAFHLNDCAHCVGLLERLDPADPPDLPDELQEEIAGEIGRRLGFEVAEPMPETRGWFGRLLRFRVPALVPLAVAAMALAMFWWVGGSGGPSGEAPPVIRQLPIFSIDQTLSRSEGESGTAQAVEAGEPFVLEVFFDRLDLEPGDRIRFTVTDRMETVVLNGDSVVLPDYNARLALSFSKPGPYTVILTNTTGIELERVEIEVNPTD